MPFPRIAQDFVTPRVGRSRGVSGTFKLAAVLVLATLSPASEHKLPSYAIVEAWPRYFPSIGGLVHQLHQAGLVVQADVATPLPPCPSHVRFTDSRGVIVDVPIVGPLPMPGGVWQVWTPQVWAFGLTPGEAKVSVVGPYVVRSGTATVRLGP